MKVYAPKNRDPKYLKQKLNRIERKNGQLKKIVSGNFNTLLQ